MILERYALSGSVHHVVIYGIASISVLVNSYSYSIKKTQFLFMCICNFEFILDLTNPSESSFSSKKNSSEIHRKASEYYPLQSVGAISLLSPGDYQPTG